MSESNGAASQPGLSDLADDIRPRLAPGVRMMTGRLSGQALLVFPEAMVELKGPGPAIVRLCDGRRRLDQIIDILAQQYGALPATLRADVVRYLLRLRDRMLLDIDGPEVPRSGVESETPSPRVAPAPPLPDGLPRPLGLIAEVTHRCPLHCPYCSNPTDYPQGRSELSSDDWRRVFEQAADLGVIHALFSGGEPLVRKDLETMITSARQAGLYTNLITSAIGLTPARAQALKQAGLDSVQISFQADEENLADTLAGTTAHAAKLNAASLVRTLGFPLTVNVVLHRRNIDRVAAIIALAESLGARRLELANTQFYGWAVRNRNALLPTRQQVDEAEKIAGAAQLRLKGVMDVLYVVPDYFSDLPKPCMNGWGTRYIAVNPIGDVLPCPTAGEIRSMHFDNVHDRELGWIWEKSPAFTGFRGTAWMPEPCQSCPRRDIDFGGCRCQAALLTGNAARTDPVCKLSPDHGLIEAALSEAGKSVELSYRQGPRI